MNPNSRKRKPRQVSRRELANMSSASVGRALLAGRLERIAKAQNAPRS
jgi:hypothetical protein